MKLALKIIGGLVVVLVLVIAVQFIASESGEVVVVTTTDADGVSAETRLWVVDHEGSAYLRSGSPQSGWFQRMQANPTIGVVRGETSMRATVEPDVSLRDTVNDLMREKYGWADAYISMLFGRADATPIRIVPEST